MNTPNIKEPTWYLYIWNDDTKTAAITPNAQTGSGGTLHYGRPAFVATDQPITFVGQVDIIKQVSSTYDYTITFPLQEWRAQNISALRAEGTYFELYRGKQRWVWAGNEPAFWENGYIVNIVEQSEGMALQLQCKSPSWFLNWFITLGVFWAGPGQGYTDLIDHLQGLGGYPTNTTPGHMGVLPPQWSVNYIDQINTPAIDPNAVGLGNVIEGNFDTSANDLLHLIQTEGQNMYYREGLYGGRNLGYKGQLDLGPMGDVSGFSAYGATALLDDMRAHHGYDPEGRLDKPDLDTAQRLGYAVITSMEKHSDRSLVRNLAWLIGKGKWEHNLQGVAGGPPVGDDGVTLQNGWTRYTPPVGAPNFSGRVLYTKAAVQYVSFDGTVFSFVAARNNGEGGSPTEKVQTAWDYGIIDLTSCNTFGVREYTLPEYRIVDPVLLVGAGIGALITWGKPLHSWTATIQMALISDGGIPARVHPGQLVDLHYYKDVRPADYITDSGSPYFGQNAPAASYNSLAPTTFRVLDYPGTTDPLLKKLLARVTQVEEHWPQGTLTLTLGQNKAKRTAILTHLARQLIQKHHHDGTRVHSFYKQAVNGTTWLLSTLPLCWESRKDQDLHFNPGATAVCNVPHHELFGDGQNWSFTVQGNWWDQYLDCWIGKPIDGGPAITGTVASGASSTVFTVNAGDAHKFDPVGMPIQVNGVWSVISGLSGDGRTITLGQPLPGVPAAGQAVLMYPQLLSPNPGPGKRYVAFRLAWTAGPESGNNCGTSTGFYWTQDGLNWNRIGETYPSTILDSSDRLSVRGHFATDGVATTGSTAFASATSTFGSRDVGQRIIINGAGVGGSALNTTIAALVDAHHVTLGAAADLTVSGAPFSYGMKDTHVLLSWRQHTLQARLVVNNDDGTELTDSGSHQLVAQWTDTSATGDPTSPDGSHILDHSRMGAVGYKVHQGSNDGGNALRIFRINAVAHNEPVIGPVAHHPNFPHANQWKGFIPQVTGYNKATGATTVVFKKLHRYGFLVLKDMSVPRNGWNGSNANPMIWDRTAIPDPMPNPGTPLTVYLPPGPIDATHYANSTNPHWIVYNAEPYSISDGHSTIASRHWGALNLTKTGNHSWANVWVLGHLSLTVDAYTKKPWVEGWHPGTHQGAGVHSAPQSKGRGHDHRHKYTTKSRRKKGKGGKHGHAVIGFLADGTAPIDEHWAQHHTGEEHRVPAADGSTSYTYADASVATLADLGSIAAVNAGDRVLINIGYQDTYVSEDGLVTIKFGAAFANPGDVLYSPSASLVPAGSNPLSGTNTFGGLGTYAYSGPYAVIPIGGMQPLVDDGFVDIEELDQKDYVLDAATQEYPSQGRAGKGKVHSLHHALWGVVRRVLHPHDHTRHHWENMKFYFSLVGGLQHFSWVQKDPTLDGNLRLDDGTVLHNFPHGSGSSFTCPAKAIVVYNWSASPISLADPDGVSNPLTIAAHAFDYVLTSTDLTTDDAHQLVKVGHVDATTDANTGLLGMSGWHANVHVGQSQQIATGALDASHIRPSDTTGGGLAANNWVLASNGTISHFVDPATLPSDTDNAITDGFLHLEFLNHHLYAHSSQPHPTITPGGGLSATGYGGYSDSAGGVTVVLPVGTYGAGLVLFTINFDTAFGIAPVVMLCSDYDVPVGYAALGTGSFNVITLGAITVAGSPQSNSVSYFCLTTA